MQLSIGIVLMLAVQGASEPSQSSQQTEQAAGRSAEQAANETPIIVTEDRENANETAVVVGSRIPKKPRYAEFEHNFRTRTGLGGLGPGSGLQPMSLQNPVMRSQISTCQADNDAIGAKAACLLLSAKQNIADGQTQSGADIYRYLTSSDEYVAEERRTAGEELYRLGNTLDDGLMREEALLRLVASGALPPERMQSAQRSLVTLALKRQDYGNAITRLELVVEADPADAQNLANLAVLLRQEGREGSADRMAQAITAREAQGRDVPEEWRSF